MWYNDRFGIKPWPTFHGVVRWIVAAAFATAMLSCGERSYPPVLLTVDSLCEVRPDSAMAMLQAIDTTAIAPGSEAHWYYRMLRIKAKMKQFAILNRADHAEAKAILEHYQDGDDPNMLAYAHYVMATACQDINDAPMAMDHYRQAIATLQDTTRLQLRSAFNYRAGFLLLVMGFGKESIGYFRTSYRMEQLRKDTAMMAFCLEKMASAYWGQGKRDSSNYCLGKAISLARSSNDTLLEKSLVVELGAFHYRDKNFEEAERCVRPFLPYTTEDNRLAVYVIMAEACMEIGKEEEAKAYCDVLLSYESIDARQTAYYLLVKYYAAHNELDSVQKYVKSYQYASDSISKVNAQEAVAHIEAYYNYNAYKEKNAELAVENAHKAEAITLLISAVAICIAGFAAYWFVERRKRKERRQRVEAKLKWMRDNSDAQIAENNRKIAQLQQELDQARLLSDERAMQLTHQKEALEMANAIAYQQRQFSNATSKRIVESAIYNKVREKADQCQMLSETDWREIDAFVQELLPGFKTTILSIASISEQDYRLCLLIRLGGLKGREMAYLLNRTDSAITKAKKRLQDKMMSGCTDKNDLKEFIDTI